MMRLILTENEEELILLYRQSSPQFQANLVGLLRQAAILREEGEQYRREMDETPDDG